MAAESPALGVAASRQGPGSAWSVAAGGDELVRAVDPPRSGGLVVRSVLAVVDVVSPYERIIRSGLVAGRLARLDDPELAYRAYSFGAMAAASRACSTLNPTI